MSREKRGPKVRRPYNPEELLRETNDTSSTSLMWPNAVHHKLDALVTCADKGGLETTRTDMAAAIIALTELDSESLIRTILRYRTSTGADIGMTGEENQEA